MTGGENVTIQERLNIIAAALETASKQVRMLAAEMPAPETAQETINAINQRMLRC